MENLFFGSKIISQNWKKKNNCFGKFAIPEAFGGAPPSLPGGIGTIGTVT